MVSPSIVWFRNDLRLAGNDAVAEAAQGAAPVVGLYVRDEESADLRPLGGAARWWLHHALASLARGLEERGSRLVVLRGPAAAALEAAVSALGAGAVFWNRRYDAAGIAVDTAVKAALRARGVRAESFNASLLYEPWQVKSASGEPLKVFTPFWRAARALGEPRAPRPAPERLGPAAIRRRCGQRFTGRPRPAAAQARLGRRAARDVDARGGRGRGSGSTPSSRTRSTAMATGGTDPTGTPPPAFRHGFVSARSARGRCGMRLTGAQRSGVTPASERDLDKFRAELGWREFSYHLLHQRPDMARSEHPA